ncbi:MAG: glycosyltransferase [Bacteroidia bacterium]|nr:glycosyltransferase [Bacteroidia bacterium]
MPNTTKNKRILFVGQALYNHWYLAQELCKIDWEAHVLNTDLNNSNANFYHGENFSFLREPLINPEKRLRFYFYALRHYDLFHFANSEGIVFLNQYDGIKKSKKGLLYGITHIVLTFLFTKILRWRLSRIYALVYLFGTKGSHWLLKIFAHHLPERWDILLIKKINKRIVYTNNGCLDGVLRSSFNKWSTPDNNPICSTICHYKNSEDICSDLKNKKWGEFRNNVADYQCLLGGNRVDYNISKKIHERPEVYALDKNFWNPDLLIPTNYLLPISKDTVKLFHSVGNFDSRSKLNIQTIKSTHIYFKTVEQLKEKGYNVDLIFFKDVPNKIIRYYQLQADIIVDMLTFGFFGANIREGLMLGKPCICYLRPEWLEQMRSEIPGYVDELPIINATPSTIENILIDLITNPAKRKDVGLKSRQFAEKWHASDVAAKKMASIYSKLILEKQQQIFNAI